MQVAPWSKTGGLGDVLGSLPVALAERGHRVMVVVPRYACYEEPVDTEVSGRSRRSGHQHTGNIKKKIREWGQRAAAAAAHARQSEQHCVRFAAACRHWFF